MTCATRSTPPSCVTNSAGGRSYQDFERGLEATIAWYRENADWWRPQKAETEAKYQVLGR